MNKLISYSQGELFLTRVGCACGLSCGGHTNPDVGTSLYYIVKKASVEELCVSESY
jgi:hypothetical protein